MFTYLTNSVFKLKSEWKITPAPSILTHQPTITDTLVDGLASKQISSTPGIRRFTGSRSVELTNGAILEDIDAVICCTGFTLDFSLISDMTPVLFSPAQADLWTSHPNSDGRPIPRLYQNVFPLKNADSVVYLNNFSYPTGYMPVADLSSMAIVQVWKGASSLPSVGKMEAQIDGQHAWLIKQLHKDTVASDFVQEESWLRAMHDLAGTGCNEMLGYGLTGWKWWWSDPVFAGLVMGGVESPFMMRLFDGKRKKWDGARQAIEETNRQAGLLGEEKSKASAIPTSTDTTEKIVSSSL